MKLSSTWRCALDLTGGWVGTEGSLNDRQRREVRRVKGGVIDSSEEWSVMSSVFRSISMK